MTNPLIEAQKLILQAEKLLGEFHAQRYCPVCTELSKVDESFRGLTDENRSRLFSVYDKIRKQRFKLDKVITQHKLFEKAVNEMQA